jgi:hypothetical protein
LAACHGCCRLVACPQPDHASGARACLGRVRVRQAASAALRPRGWVGLARSGPGGPGGPHRGSTGMPVARVTSSFENAPTWPGCLAQAASGSSERRSCFCLVLAAPGPRASFIRITLLAWRPMWHNLNAPHGLASMLPSAWSMQQGSKSAVNMLE